MNPIPISTLTLNLPMRPENLPYFRGAVIQAATAHQQVFEAAGVPVNVFHNHGEAGPEPPPGQAPPPNELYRYPLIQYKVHHQRAEIVGIGPAAKAPELWLAMAGGSISMQGKSYPLGVYKRQHEQWQPVVNGQLSTYRLNKWLPLNVKNYETWQQSPMLTQKAALLDKALWGNMFHLLEGLGAQVQREALQLFVSSIDMQTYKRAYKTTLLALDVTFCSNLHLPAEIGLGQKVSVGFGKVQPISTKHPPAL